MKNWVRRCSGVVLLVVGLCGVVRGTRAGLGQFLYYHCKFGWFKQDPDVVFECCEWAHKLYPIDYYFCMWTAEKAYYSSLEPGVHPVWRDRRWRLAGEWCERGLRLNPYKSPLRLLKTRLLAENSLGDAIGYWQRFVEWQFWNPYNHAVLAELYARQGDRGRAEQELGWVKDSKLREESAVKVEAALAEYVAPPAES